MRYLILIFIFLLSGLFCSTAFYGQVTTPPPVTTAPANDTTPDDSLLTIEILPGVRKLEFRKVDDSTQLQILAGNVKLKQGNTLFYCDSCVINNHTNTFESWGHVHINDSDTADVYSSHMIYYILKKTSYLDGGVRLTDGKGTLTTPDLDYDLNTKIGTYKHGGKVINKKSVLTSQEGVYYTDLRDVYFKNNVQLKDPAYFLQTDSLLYNTESDEVRFIAETFIRDSSGRTIETREGYRNLKTGKSEFGRRPVIRDKGLYATGAQMISDDSTGEVQFRGNALIRDSVNNTTILAGEIYINNKLNSFLAIKKPLMIVKQDNDSVFITADTLFSARLSDLKGVKNILPKDMAKSVTTANVGNKDSTNRYFEAYRNVRIFTDSLQSACDSLFYSFKDSAFRLYQNPVIWAKESQITGDTIYLFTKNKKADRMKVFENSLLVNRADPEVYNQVKSTRMDAYFKDGSIDSARCFGSAECIYFIQDDDSAYTGINE
jgi:lipopolysaccharide export system protein LptA